MNVASLLQLQSASRKDPLLQPGLYSKYDVDITPAASSVLLGRHTYPMSMQQTPVCRTYGMCLALGRQFDLEERRSMSAPGI
jgi:hypothetical protein